MLTTENKDGKCKAENEFGRINGNNSILFIIFLSDIFYSTGRMNVAHVRIHEHLKFLFFEIIHD